MAATATYAGVDTPDVAAVSSGGEFFRCYVWRNVALNRIDATVFVEQADGQESIVWTGVVRDTEADGATDALCDSPKVLALSTGVFICHWFEHDEGNSLTLHRASFNTQQMANDWGYLSSITVQSQWMIYDHAPVRNVVTGVETSDEFVVVWVAGEVEDPPDIGGGIGVGRYESPYAWTDTVWSITEATTIENRVLAIAADDDASGRVVIMAQQTTALNAHTLQSSDGTYLTTAAVSTGHAASQYASVGVTQYPGTSDAVFVAEFQLDANATTGGVAAYQRGILYRDIDVGTLGPDTSVQTCLNLHLCSRPWARRNGFSGEYEVFVLTSYKTIEDTRGWDQTFGFVVRLNHHEWGASVAANVVRPIPCATLNNGSFDGRAGGYSPTSGGLLVGGTVNKRTNHISNASIGPQFSQGPDVRGIVIAAMHFEQNISGQDGDLDDGERDRAQAAVKGVRFYHEEPWTSRDDEDLPDLPAASNFRGYAPYSIGRSVEVQSGLVFGGGVLSQYDGRQIVEVGFLWAPELINVSQMGATTIDAGDYWVAWTYSWTDQNGSVHRSAPSIPLLVTVAAGGTASLTHTVRTINLTMKDDRFLYPNTGPILIEGWRTTRTGGAIEANSAGSFLLRRIYSGPTSGHSITDTPLNDATAHTITATDSIANSVLQYNDLLPWQISPETGGWSTAVPSPTVSARALAKWNNRLWSVPHDDPRVIQYSDEHLPVGLQTAATEHFDDNKYRFDSRGDVVAMHAMDNSLIIFTRDGIFSLVGEGNDGTGTGANLQLQVVAEGIGCVSDDSVVRIPNGGLMFQSDNGFWVLARTHELTNASTGTALSELVRTMGNVRKGTLLADRHIVRYVANLQPALGVEDPVMLDYNYELGVWAQHPVQNIAGLATRLNAMQFGEAWRGRQGQICHVMLAQNGLCVELGDDSTTFSDENYQSTGQAIPLDVQTEWISLSGIAGLKRVPSIGIQTERVNAGAMTVETWYDFVGDFDETTPDETFTWASPAPSYLLIKPGSQKFSSIMLRIYESGTVPQTENVRLISLTLNVAKKTGLRRVPRTQIG